MSSSAFGIWTWRGRLAYTAYPNWKSKNQTIVTLDDSNLCHSNSHFCSNSVYVYLATLFSIRFSGIRRRRRCCRILSKIKLEKVHTRKWAYICFVNSFWCAIITSAFTHIELFDHFSFTFLLIRNMNMHRILLFNTIFNLRKQSSGDCEWEMTRYASVCRTVHGRYCSFECVPMLCFEIFSNE